MTPAEIRKDFLKRLDTLGRSVGGTAQAFRDFNEAHYCAVAKSAAHDPKRAEDLEQRYLAVVRRYPAELVREHFPALAALTAAGIEAGGDFLGVLAAEASALSARAGQFFTPYHM
jgi:hypothetical protein